MTYFTQFQKSDYILSDSVSKRLTNISHYTDIFSRIADDISFYTFYYARPDQRFDNISQELYDTTDFYWTIPILNDRIINTWRDTIKSVPSFEQFLEKKYPGKALIVESSDDIIGKFTIGEEIRYDNSDVYILREKYASFNYLRVEKVESSETVFPETNDNEVIGADSGSVVEIASVIDWSMAPARFIDSDGNSVPYYAENTTPISIAQIETERNDEKGKLKVIRPEFINDVVDRFEIEMNGTR